MKILYVHGYNGDPYGESYNNLKNQCGTKHELHTIDYDPNKPIDAIKIINKYVDERMIELIIGASLGGFLTMNVFGVSRIVVNPCWNPAIELPKIGYTGNVDSYCEMLQGLKDNSDFEEYHLCSGVFSSNDELLGLKYVTEFKKYFNLQFFIDGPHRITSQMANTIINDILLKHEKEASEYCAKLKAIDILRFSFTQNYGWCPSKNNFLISIVKKSSVLMPPSPIINADLGLNN